MNTSKAERDKRLNEKRKSRFDERKNARKNKRKFQEMSLVNSFSSKL